MISLHECRNELTCSHEIEQSELPADHQVDRAVSALVKLTLSIFRQEFPFFVIDTLFILYVLFIDGHRVPRGNGDRPAVLVEQFLIFATLSIVEADNQAASK